MHRLAVPLACALALLLPPVAGAQDGPAAAALDGAELRVHRDDGSLCIDLDVERGYGASSCADGRPTAAEPVVAETRRVTAYAFPPAITTVTSDAGGRVTQHTTFAVDGFSARFLLLPRTRTRGAIIRAYDAAGTLVGASQEDRVTWEDDARVVLEQGKVRVAVKRPLVLRPDPAALDHTVPVRCVFVRVRRGSGGGCEDPDRRQGLTASERCAADGSLVWGLAPDAVTRVAVVLGSGRVLRRVTRRLPSGWDARLVVVPTPAGEAIRRVDGFATGGRRLLRRRLGLAPSDAECGEGRSIALNGERATGLRQGRPTVPFAPAAADGGHVVLAADGTGRTLCTAVDHPDQPLCLVPPVLAEDALLQRVGRTLGGVVTAEVTTVDLQLDDGRRIRAATDSGAAYTGRFAGRVRFVAVRLPAGRTIDRLVARDASGRRLGDLLVFPRTGRIVRRPVAPGLELLRAVTVAEPLRVPFTCVTARRRLSSGEQAGVCAGPYEQQEAHAAVTCEPRRAIVFGRLQPGATGVTVTLGDGRRMAARIRAIPASGGSGRWSCQGSPPSAASTSPGRCGGRPPDGRRATSRSRCHRPPSSAATRSRRSRARPSACARAPRAASGAGRRAAPRACPTCGSPRGRPWGRRRGRR